MANLSAILSGVNRLRNGTPSATIISPDLATPTAVNATGAAWTYGTVWTVIQSSGTLTNHALSQINAGFGSGATYWQVDVATGVAGSEVVVYRTRFETVSGAGMFMPIPVYPLVNIPTNEAVSIRAATAAGTTTVNIRVSMTFVPRPI